MATEKVVALAKQEIAVVAVSDVGPPGPPGPPGAGGETSFQLLTASAIGGHRVVAADSSGRAVYASNDIVVQSAKVVGITVSAVGAGELTVVVRSGEVEESSWNWDTDLPVYLGTNGTLTQVPPVIPAAFSLVVGFPMTSTKLFVSIREPIILGA